jgi:hypothetical protein
LALDFNFGEFRHGEILTARDHAELDSRAAETRSRAARAALRLLTEFA